ncbi:MAG: hypothetical protein GY757_11495 [bacterium]|nr:hypothetical protein [bacterium]
MKLNIRSFGLTLGIVYGLLLFLATWWLIIRGEVPPGERVMLSYIYPFYTVSPLGSLLGLLYGFVDGLIIGFPLAWIYNKLTENSNKKLQVADERQGGVR